MIPLRRHFVRYLFAAIVCAGLVPWGKCYGLSKPRLRISDYFGAPGGVDYLNPDELGRHCYRNSREEKVGMVYTRHGGFFDIGHVREAADRTRYAVHVLYENLLRSKNSFQFNMIEPSRYYIKVKYPDNWNKLSKTKRADIAREVSIRYGQYLGHQSLIWHELLTWFGYSSTVLFSEHISSFSWEDPYSDVMGTCLAVEAIRSRGDYDEEMTRLLAEKLTELGAEPADVGREADEIVKGKWYTGGNYFFVEMQKRSFDVGFDDGLVMPWLVPGLFPDAEPKPCPIPYPDWLDDFDFKFNVQLEPNVAEKAKIYNAINLDPTKDRLRIYIDFPKLLDAIKDEAFAQKGPDVDKPIL